jgi:hypothetical protein
MKRILLCIILCLFAYCNSFANLTQGHWRWRNNNGTEKTATWKAGQDTAATISNYNAIRLRTEVYNNSGNVKTIDHGLQYATSPLGPWFNISNVSAINAFVFGGNNSYISSGDSTTKQIVDDAYTFFPGTIITQEDSNADTILNNYRREYEWCIKPTSQIQPNTTYYFKSSAGGDQSTLPSLTTTGNMFIAGPQPILPNGGFENDLTGWATSTTNGSAATFNITTATNYFHTGAKALAVTVTNTGASNSVTLSSGSVTLKDTGTYMLRFWAIAKQRNALLDIELKSATTDNTCHYQIYNRFDTTKNGWQMYQYAFKVTESPVTLQMHFNTNTTYYLDDVEIINDVTNPNIDVKTQYVWQNNFNESYGWLSGDNNNPVLLPDNRVAWIYNDSFMGINNPNSNVLSSSRIINNLVVTRSGDQLTSTYAGTAPNSQALFSPNNGNLFWQSGGIIENNSLKILLIEISNGNYAGHSWVGTLSLPDLKVGSLNKLPATINVNPNCIIADGAYDYIYFGQSSGSFEVHTIVARVPAGQFDSQTPWQYYTGDTTWSADYTKAKNILEGVSAGNVIKLGPNNYVMAGVPNLASEIDAWFAPTPYGPWGNKTVIYNIPQQEGILAYEGHLDPTSRNGFYTFTYSVYPFVNEPDGSSGSVAMQIADKTTYVPCYAKANLLQLSPYTCTKSADSLSSFTGKVIGQTVQLNWTAARKNDDHYDVQHSSDGKTWQVITTVAGADSVSLANYAAVDNSPVNGVNYYRIALYDVDSKLTLSKVVCVSTLQTANVISFTAINKSPKVELDWSTSSELNNSGFTVQKSTDGVNFTTLTSVKGGGTSNTTLNYSAVDPTPFDGINYYRLGYLSNSKDTLSAVVSIKLPADSLVSFTGKDVDQNVQLNWAIANNNIDHFIIQHSTNGTVFTNLVTVAGNDSASYLNYKTIDNAPAAGTNYYRIEMHDIDSNVTLSAVITVNTTQNANLSSFTAVADGTTKVKLDWSTSSEQNNTLFTVERSADSVTFVTLTIATGAGTTTTPTSYEKFDESPFNGINYYRLSYLSNGKDTTSVVRSVDMSQILAVHVYPNPTNAAIQFTLKGYKGSSFNIILSSLAGRIVDKETFNVINNGVYILQNKPADGIYILKLTGKGLSKSNRVIVL